MMCILPRTAVAPTTALAMVIVLVQKELTIVTVLVSLDGEAMLVKSQ